MEKITTFDGTIANKKDCRFIKGEFYKKNEQCFLIDGVWYRINSGYIAFDHETNDWKLIKNSPMVYGVINYNDFSNEVVLGYFTPNKYRNVMVVIDETNQYTCINEKILKNKFHIDTKTLKYYPISKKVSAIPSSSFRFGALNTYSPELNYNVRTTSQDIIDNIKKYTSEKLDEYVPEENICKNLRKYLPNFTYGIEFETCYGMVPWHHLVESGLIPLRDGSINGFEYATLAYPSTVIGKGISLACSYLNKYTAISENESLHLHIGIPKVSKSLVSILYVLCCILEKDIFELFPKFYSKTSQFKARGKDYNKPLVKNLVDLNLDTTFDNLAMYLSLGKPYEGFGSSHPSDPDGQHKWAVETRYHYVNFINLLFGNNKTLEFRVHTPTKNPYKIANWILITSAIVKYAIYINGLGEDYNISNLKRVTLMDVIEHSYAGSYKIKSLLKDYIDMRKADRVKADEFGDYIGSTEIKNDLEYKITTNFDY